MQDKIKSTDLRSGNYLQGEPISIPREGISSNGITAITAYGIQQIEQGRDLKLKPIELTEEWLDYAEGFTRDRENKFDKNTPMYFFPDSMGVLKIELERYYITCNGVIIARCQYVHQLQNFYYLMYGTELKLKQASRLKPEHGMAIGEAKSGTLEVELTLPSKDEMLAEGDKMANIKFGSENPQPTAIGAYKLGFSDGTRFVNNFIRDKKYKIKLSEPEKHEPAYEKPSLEKCLEGMRSICEGTNFSEEELKHRARLLYLTHRLSFWDELPVMLDLVMYERELERRKK